MDHRLLNLEGLGSFIQEIFIEGLLCISSVFGLTPMVPALKELTVQCERCGHK